MMQLETLLSKIFIDSIWMTTLVSAIGIIGFFMAIIFYFKSKKNRIPKFEMKSNNLINNQIGKYDALKVLYNDKVIDNLTITKISFWNEGGETINREDIASGDPINIVACKDFKIFDVRVIKVVNPINKFAILDNNSGIYLIDFEYLDKNEGAILQVIHNGNTSSDIELKGTIKGFGSLSKALQELPFVLSWLGHFHSFTRVFINKFFEVLYKDNCEIEFKKKNVKRKFVGLLSLMMPVYFMIDLFFQPQRRVLPLWFNITLSLIVFIAYYSLAFYLLKRRMPRGLELF